MTDTGTFRTFIAVKIPIAERLQRILQALRNVGRPVKAVADDHLHVTLKFLGDVCRDRTDEISRMLDNVCAQRSAFRITLTGIGAFPRVERPSVIWAGICSGEPLIEIATAIETKCETLGYPHERRPFQPHLTLARVRTHRGRRGTPIPPGLLEIMQEFQEMEFGHVEVNRIVLFRSQLNADGPEYSELSAAELSTRLPECE